MVSIFRSASLMTRVDLLGLRQHGDGRGGGVDAPLRLGRRHPLHPMNAALEFQPREDAAAGDLGDDLLVAARRALARRQDVDLPAFRLGVFDVHAEEIAGEQGRLVAAGSRPHFEDDVALVGGVLGQKREADRLRHRLEFGFDARASSASAIARISGSSPGSASSAARSARSRSLSRQARIAVATGSSSASSRDSAAIFASRRGFRPGGRRFPRSGAG